MARMSEIAALAATLVFVAPAVSAPQHRSGSSQQQSKGAGTDEANDAGGITTGSAGLGTGRAATGPSTNTDAAVQAENQLLDRKLKSICRGC
jgi:hypothetical protein